jgi:GNAT superfamily N-acetyltransferase
VRIEYLCRHPHLAPELAAAHAGAFGSLLPDWSHSDALAELRGHTREREIPTTLVALSADARHWLGSVSLLHEDDARIRQYSPWLASLYVCPEARGRGLGQALVTRCVADARALGVARLYLYCERGLVAFYSRLGWCVHDRLALGGIEVTVMAFDLADRSLR